MQKRRYSIANALDLRLFCNHYIVCYPENPLIKDYRQISNISGTLVGT